MPGKSELHTRMHRQNVIAETAGEYGVNCLPG